MEIFSAGSGIMIVVSVVLLIAFFLAILVKQYKRCPSNRIPVVITQLAHSVVINRAEMTSKLTAFSPNMDQLTSMGVDPMTQLATLNAQVQTQAMMIGYIDDFRLMMFVTLAMMPLLLFMHSPGKDA